MKCPYMDIECIEVDTAGMDKITECVECEVFIEALNEQADEQDNPNPGGVLFPPRMREAGRHLPDSAGSIDRHNYNNNQAVKEKDYTYHDVINFTSVDDIRVILNYHNDKRSLPYLRRSLEFEPKHLNRISVIKMLEGKIKKLEKK
jgi:hypothetical protein